MSDWNGLRESILEIFDEAQQRYLSEDDALLLHDERRRSRRREATKRVRAQTIRHLKGPFHVWPDVPVDSSPEIVPTWSAGERIRAARARLRVLDRAWLASFTPVPFEQRLWTHDEESLVVAMKLRGESWNAIGRAVGRKPFAAKRRWHDKLKVRRAA